jgi:UDP-galactopyranose mutase
MKKGFTLLDIVMSIIVASLITAFMMKDYSHNQWLTSVNKMNDEIINIVDNGVMNSQSGYINQSGGDCSSDLTYTNISAGRVVECNSWSGAYPYLGTKNTLGTDSYITLMKEYTANAVGCRLYIDDASTESFYLYLDCSAVNYQYGDAPIKAYVEQKFLSNVKNKFSTIYQSVDLNATSVNLNSGGTIYDGKIRVLLKK